MTNRERYFGTDYDASRTEVRFMLCPRRVDVLRSDEEDDDLFHLVASLPDRDGYRSWLREEYLSPDATQAMPA